MDPYRLEQLRTYCRDDAAFEQMKLILLADVRQQNLDKVHYQASAGLTRSSLPPSFTTQSQTPTQQNYRPALLRVMARIRSSLEPSVILRVAASDVRQLLGADRVSIFHFTPNTHHRRGEFVSEEVIPGLPSVLHDETWNPCFGDRFATRYQQGYVHVVNDLHATALSDDYLRQLYDLGVRASITSPINRDGNLWGLLCIHQCHAPRNWSPDEIELVSHVASQLGVALQQAELLSRTRDALGQSETKFQRLAERVPGIIFQGMFDFQANLSFSYISPGCQRIYGFTAEEILRNPSLVIEAVHPDDVTAFEATIETAIQTLRPWRWEGRIRMPSGEIKWLRGDAHLELRENGILADGLLIDITEQKQTEAALRTSESEIRALFAAIPDTVFVIDSTGRLRRLSSTHPVTLHRSLEEQSDKTLHDLFPAAEADRFLDYVRQVLSTQQTTTMEYAVTIDGSDRWFSASISPVTTDTVIWVARDITDRRQMEEALRESELSYRTLVESANSAIVRWDAHGTITFVNDFAQRFFGYTEEELLGRNILGTILPAVDSQGQDLAAMLQDLIRHPERYITHEHENMRRNGERVWLEWTNKAFLDEQGNLVSMLSVGLDATERRRAQQALEQAKREAEAANRAKSEFLAMMSHEIRTPMNAVIGMAGLLLDTELTLEQRDFAETIRNSGDALLTIINDILDFSKIESGKLDLEEHPFNLRDCLESVIDLLAPKVAEKNLDLVYYIDPDVPTVVQGDVTRLRQVLMNLLSNAVKFTATGEVVVHVAAQQLGRGRLITNNDQATLPVAYTNIYPIYELEFSVRDTGIGIP
ncbi:MAG: PAS domain S-box protein, partial [Cyanobacteria bacterium]|nr:PAS domain S-box protein [Cyanobacteriota bacterium]